VVAEPLTKIANRNPDVDWRADEAADERRLGDADDGVAGPIQQHGAAEYGLAAEPPPPQGVADHCRRRRCRRIVALDQQPAANRARTKEREVAAGGDLAKELIGAVVRFEQKRRQVDTREVLDRRGPLAVVGEV